MLRVNGSYKGTTGRPESYMARLYVSDRKNAPRPNKGIVRDFINPSNHGTQKRLFLFDFSLYDKNIDSNSLFETLKNID